MKLTTEMCALHFMRYRIYRNRTQFLYERSNRRLQCRFGMNQVKVITEIT
jgi:hypothetical protein